MAHHPSQIWASFLPYDLAQRLAEQPDTLPVGAIERGPVVALFADIHGFTALSEALAAHGPGGAEELTSALNAYFSPIIAQLSQDGGITATFGGDALTAFFPHEPAAQAACVRRAVSCALAIQRHLASHDELITSCGRFHLSMRIGLAAGPLLRTVVGDPATRLERICAGKVLEQAAAAEARAIPGEVVVPQALLPLLGATNTSPRGEAHAPDAFVAVHDLRRQPDPAPLPPLPPFPSAAQPLAAAFLPPTIARRISAGQTSFVGERRAVTVLFLRFSGFDYDHDPQIGPKLQRYLGQIFALVQRYGGYVNKVDMGDKGSKILILFGAPVAHTDDATRAMACALDLRAVPGARVCCGIALGLVYSGLVGAATRQEYTVIGDTVNLAARLMQAAAPDQILVAPAARRAAGPQLRWGETQLLQLKGRSKPLAAATLAGVTNVEPTQGRSSTPLALLGRTNELAQLETYVQTALAGQGQIVVLRGEAGLGKSALAAAALREAARNGFVHLNGTCVSYYTASSYTVWRPVISNLLGLRLDWPGEQQIAYLQHQVAARYPQLAQRLPLLGAMLGLAMPDTPLTADLSGEIRKVALESLVGDLFSEITSPLALTLESCDWIDPLARDLLVAVARRIANVPVLLLITMRGSPSEREDWFAPLQAARLAYLHEVRLGALADSELHRLVTNLIRRRGEDPAAAQALINTVVTRAQGNPLFAEELLALIYDRGLARAQATSDMASELPNSLHSLVQSRIDRLEAEAQTTLKVASVVGQQFSPAWLAALYPSLADVANCERQLTLIEQSELILRTTSELEPDYQFRHVLTREVAYRSLARTTSAVLHERAGAYLERRYADDLERHLELLAYHYGQSENQAKKCEYLARAAAAAQHAFAAETAARLYEQLLPLLPAHEQSATLVQLAEMLRHMGRWDEAEARLHQALHQAPDQRMAGRARLALGALQLRRGAYASARDWIRASRLDFATTADQASDGEAIEQLGIVAWYGGDLEHALQLIEQAVALSDVQDRRRIAQLHNNAGLVYLALGDYPQALISFEQGRQAAEAANNQQYLGVIIGNLGNLHLARRDYAQAHACYRQKLERAQQIGDRMEIGVSIANLGTIYELQGAYGQAQQCFARALSMALDLGDQLGIGLALWGLGSAQLKAGELVACAALLQQAAVVLATLEANYELSDCLLSQAELALRQHDLPGALALLGDAQSLAEASDHHEALLQIRLLTARLQAELGQTDPASLISQVTALLADHADEAAQAAICFTLVRLDPARAHDREQAAQRYARIYQHSPNADYRLRYHELTGVMLPEPAPLPELPPIITHPPLDRAALLQRIDRLFTKPLTTVTTTVTA
ncbi:MAG: tetratricopeptide repeat protein [Oscillochloridaceae bacterium umkhey_bin13]